MRTSRDASPRRFRAGLAPPDAASSDAIVFAFSRERVLVKELGHDLEVPRRSTFDELGLPLAGERFLGVLDRTSCFVASLPNEIAVPAGFRLLGLRALFGRIDVTVLEVAGLASHIHHWDRQYLHCPRCRTPLDPKSEERAKRCATCGSDYFPLVSPCTIVLVHDGPRIVMTRAARFPPGMYGLVAGFVEPGETLEACVVREVREETGLEVEGVEYFASQPWPFPHQMMIGFFARYAGGELVVDRSELEDARWFHRDELPILPPPVSIARSLVDAWLAKAR